MLDRPDLLAVARLATAPGAVVATGGPLAEGRAPGRGVRLPRVRLRAADDRRRPAPRAARRPARGPPSVRSRPSAAPTAGPARLVDDRLDLALGGVLEPRTAGSSGSAVQPARLQVDDGRARVPGTTRSGKWRHRVREAGPASEGHRPDDQHLRAGRPQLDDRAQRAVGPGAVGTHPRPAGRLGLRPAPAQRARTVPASSPLVRRAPATVVAPPRRPTATSRRAPSSPCNRPPGNAARRRGAPRRRRPGRTLDGTRSARDGAAHAPAARPGPGAPTAAPSAAGRRATGRRPRRRRSAPPTPAAGAEAARTRRHRQLPPAPATARGGQQRRPVPSRQPRTGGPPGPDDSRSTSARRRNTPRRPIVVQRCKQVSTTRGNG